MGALESAKLHAGSVTMLQRYARLGNYEVMDLLGVGAMSMVYRARNVSTGIPVAVKVPSQHLLTSAGALRQFLREGNALVGLSHPNVVKIHACGNHEGLPYIVMQYVDGRPLSEEMRANKTYAIADSARLLVPVARALDYIHSKNIVHRDVKPGNIRLTRDGTPILVDFGIVQTGDATVWDDGKPKGSAWYMSPEQASGRRADGRSDQYSLAVIAYEMLSGHVPFDGENPYVIIVQQRDAKLPIPETWQPSLKAVMGRALEKEPNNRFSSCAEFIGAFSRAGQSLSQEESNFSKIEHLTASETGAASSSGRKDPESREPARAKTHGRRSQAKLVSRELRQESSSAETTTASSVAVSKAHFRVIAIVVPIVSGALLVAGAVYWVPRLAIRPPTSNHEVSTNGSPSKNNALNRPPAPTWVTLSALPSTTISKGDTVTLTWSTDADQLQLRSGDEVWNIQPGKSLTIRPRSSGTYTITASGPGGTQTQSIEITVASPSHHLPLRPPSKSKPKTDAGKRV